MKVRQSAVAMKNTTEIFFMPASDNDGSVNNKKLKAIK
jgi:hypothetical protein